MNAALSLPSVWGKPPAPLDQMERELQSHFDIRTRLFLPGPEEYVHASASAVQTGDHRDVWLRREDVENDPGLGFWVVFIAERP